MAIDLLLASPNNLGMNIPASQVVDALGGTAAVARLCEISMPSVSDWKKDGIPRARMMFLRVVREKELAGIDLDAALSVVNPPCAMPSQAGEVGHG